MVTWQFMHRLAGNLVVPATYLIAVTVLALNLDHLPVVSHTVWLIGPTVTVTVAGTFALSYNRSRVFYVVCILAFCMLIRQQIMAEGLNELIIVGLVPANILMIALFRERGFFTFTGLMRMALILFEFVIALYWISEQTPLPTSLLNPFDYPFTIVLDYSPFDQVATLLLVASMIGCVFAVGYDTTLISQGLITALASLALGYSIPVGQAWEVYIIAGSLYLSASIIRDSYNMAYRDELTGLPHRRALNEQFLSLGNRYSLAMLDIDHFKKFNDTHGHAVGDQILQMVAAKIRQVGGGGRAYRYGGEEFSIIFPRMKKEDALFYLDEVRKAIQNYEMVIRGKPREDEEEEKTGRKQRKRGSFRTADKKVSVTISIGVGDRATDGPLPDDVLNAADKALYATKKAGRNQVKTT